MCTIKELRKLLANHPDDMKVMCMIMDGYADVQVVEERPLHTHRVSSEFFRHLTKEGVEKLVECELPPILFIA